MSGQVSPQQWRSSPWYPSRSKFWVLRLSPTWAIPRLDAKPSLQRQHSFFEPSLFDTISNLAAVLTFGSMLAHVQKLERSSSQMQCARTSNCRRSVMQLYAHITDSRLGFPKAVDLRSYHLVWVQCIESRPQRVHYCTTQPSWYFHHR